MCGRECFQKTWEKPESFARPEIAGFTMSWKETQKPDWTERTYFGRATKPTEIGVYLVFKFPTTEDVV